MIRKVLSNTLEPIYVSVQEIRPECKACELRYRPFGTMFFIQEYNLLLKNVMFDIHHLLFQTNIFFLVNNSNMMESIKTIIVLIELLNVENHIQLSYIVLEILRFKIVNTSNDQNNKL